MQKTTNEKENGQDSGGNPEQILYADILAKGMYIGLLCLLLTFIIYVSGLLDPYIPLDKLSTYWSMNVSDYLHESGAPDGWGWLSMLSHGDFLNFIGIAILAGLTIICYVAIVPALLKKGDKIYVTLTILEVLILAFAASGIIAAGH